MRSTRLDLAPCGQAWSALACWSALLGTVWFGVVRLGTDRPGMDRFGMDRFGVYWLGVDRLAGIRSAWGEMIQEAGDACGIF